MKTRGWIIAVILVAALQVALWWPLLGGRSVLLTTDDNIGQLSQCARCLPGALLGWWDDSALLGNGIGRVPVNWTSALLLALPLPGFVNWIHAVTLLLAAACFFLWMRNRGCSTAAATLGALTAFWLSSNLAITYGGHVPKYAVLLFATLALLGIERMAVTRRWAWAWLTGGAMGLALVEQQDVGIFFGLFVGAYAVFTLWRMEGLAWRTRILTYLLPMGLMAVWLASASLLQAYTHNIQNVAVVNQESPQAKWDFITQWSLPPEETVALLAPGYVGWRSGEPEGPYCGRMGRSAGWGQTGQGFMNFKLDDWYLGVVPVLFALLICGTVWRRMRSAQGASVVTAEGPDLRADVIFWGLATLTALLLAMGKYSPLYQLFYQLPVVNNIRAPVKFMQVFQIALAVLAVYGLDYVINRQVSSGQNQRGGL
jgi:hypothetical protein